MKYFVLGDIKIMQLTDYVCEILPEDIPATYD